MKEFIPALTMIALSINVCQAQCPNYTNYPASSENQCQNERPCGIYVIQDLDNLVCVNHPNSKRCYKKNPEYYDGIFIRIPWEYLEPNEDQFDQKVLDDLTDVINFAESNPSGTVKQVSIAVIAGDFTPAWVKTKLTNQNNWFDGPLIHLTQFGNGGSKVQVLEDYPVPWDLNFIEEYNKMMHKLKDYLAGNPAGSGLPLLGFVKMIKATGVNILYAETRLPGLEQSFDAVDGTCADDMVTIWDNVNYSPDQVTNAWEEMAINTQAEFPDQFINLTILPSYQAFPPFDCNGDPLACPPGSQCPYSTACLDGNGCPASDNQGSYHAHDYNISNTNYYDVTKELVMKALANFSPCVAINNTFLTSNDLTTMPHVLSGIDILPYGLIGYQQHADPQDDWDLTDFRGAINNGINTYASFIELFPNTIDRFSNTTWNYVTEEDPSPYSNWSDWAHGEVALHCNDYVHRIASAKKSPSPPSITYIESVLHINNANSKIECSYEIYDLLGKQIAQNKITILSGDNLIETTNFHLEPAMYVFKLYGSGFEPISYKFFAR